MMLIPIFLTILHPYKLTLSRAVDTVELKALDVF